MAFESSILRKLRFFDELFYKFDKYIVQEEFEIVFEYYNYGCPVKLDELKSSRC